MYIVPYCTKAKVFGQRYQLEEERIWQKKLFRSGAPSVWTKIYPCILGLLSF